MQTGPIWLIDDDIDDQDLLAEIFSEMNLPNDLVFLTGAEAALKRLRAIDIAPFIIICEVNLPKMDGFYLRAEMLKDLTTKTRSVPFIYWSSQASEKQICQAYDLGAHGFFIKESNFPELRDSLLKIIQYWQKSKMPAKA